MPRPPCCRRVSGKPAASVFKPAGIPARMLEEVVMALDEFESIRLADFEGFYQEEAAGRMNVSRPTFGRIIESAHRKLAEAIIFGKALKIEGGPVLAEPVRAFRCPVCSHLWEGVTDSGTDCPRCHRAAVSAEPADESPACRLKRRTRWKHD
jgi:predicted DNA-binding protein (UPF0251 family)